MIYSNYNSFVPTKGTKTLLPETFHGLKLFPKCVCGLGCVPDRAGELPALPGGAENAGQDIAGQDNDGQENHSSSQ